MYVDAYRGRIAQLVELFRIMNLLCYFLRSLAEIMDSSLDQELTHEDFVFEMCSERNHRSRETIEQYLR